MNHDSRFFYKYMTAETALLILQNRTLKYSSPVLFNDPFDVQTTVSYGFTLAEYDNAFREELIRFVQSDKEPVCLNPKSFFDDLILLRRMNKIRPILSIEQLGKNLQPSVNTWTVQMENMLKDLNVQFQRAVKASRVFCVAEEPDNLLMWAHYSKDHSGVVLEFECLEEWDFPLWAARKVMYVDTPPVLAKLDEILKSQTGEGSPKDYTHFFPDMYLSKSRHWEYEKEWRVFIPPDDIMNPIVPTDKDGKEILVDFLRLHPQELSAIYFGCKIDPNDRKKMEEYLVGELGHVKRYNAIRNEREYKLDCVLCSEKS